MRTSASAQKAGKERGEIDRPRHRPKDKRRRLVRKLMIVVALVVMLVPLFAAAAFAAEQLIYCKSAPCYGSGNDDKIYERKGNRVFDKIIMKGGHDLILANGGRTRVSVR
jgi:hypothetical protein